MLGGLTAGLKMMVATMLMFSRATAAGDPVAVADIMSVYQQWVLDCTGVSLIWKGKVDQVPWRLSLMALVFGDPFQPSRELYKTVRARWERYAA